MAERKSDLQIERNCREIAQLLVKQVFVEGACDVAVCVFSESPDSPLTICVTVSACKDQMHGTWHAIHARLVSALRKYGTVSVVCG